MLKRKRAVLIGVSILAVLTIWIILSAPIPFSQAALVGAYTASVGEDEYFLELRGDSTYMQRIVRVDGSELTNTGHWRSSGLHIEVFNFKWFDPMGEFEPAGLWIAPIGRTLLGRPRLEFSQDFGFFFSYSSPLSEKKDPNE